MADKPTSMKKYMKKSEIATFGIGLFGVALMTGWMPDYTATFFADFAFKGKGFDGEVMSNAISMVFLVAGIVGAVCNDEHHENADLPIEVTESGIIIDCNDEHSLNANSPIDFTSLPKYTLVNFSQP